MKIILMLSLIFLMLGCAPAYVVPQSAKTATINIKHQGDHPSSTSVDIFSSPKCQKEFYIGELADIGTNIDLKKSATAKIEADKVVYFSGTRIWQIGGTLEVWCSNMFSFSPKEGAVYSLKIDAKSSGNCSVEIVDEKTDEHPSDLQVYKLNRICRGDEVYYEK